MKHVLIICLVTITSLYAPGSLPVADGPDYWVVHGVAGDDVLNVLVD